MRRQGQARRLKQDLVDVPWFKFALECKKLLPLHDYDRVAFLDFAECLHSRTSGAGDNMEAGHMAS